MSSLNFSLIICTYQRAEALERLLESVKNQSLFPNQILIIDGSVDEETKHLISELKFPNLEYFKVGPQDKGLTRQRNYGLSKVAGNSQIVCFLDDDVILESDYFMELLKTFSEFPDALGVCGYIINDTLWHKIDEKNSPKKTDFVYEGWFRKEGSRFRLRRKLGLEPNQKPGFMPDFSHGYSVGFIPPSGKIYPIEMLMGGVAAYRKSVFKELSFSHYFEGYGLYEDADFSLRLAKKGKLYVNTNARLEHHHVSSGRPNHYLYGKMVVKNGWYVWRIKHPHPNFKAKLKWHATSFLLTLVRLSNTTNTKKKKAALQESLGRISGWWSVIFSKPKIL